MRLDQCTWQEVEKWLEHNAGIIIPTGSTEQHGPMGIIGTDSQCADAIAQGAAQSADLLVAPVIQYSPAPFNMSFPGTISISEETFTSLFAEVVASLAHHGFNRIYVLNGHGANLSPIRKVAGSSTVAIRIRSWWDFEEVGVLREKYFGNWEGMHATPSEVAITQTLHRVVQPGDAAVPPESLSKEYVKAHAGDRHGPPDEHRRRFPDGRVGSHSALASPEIGSELLQVAISAVANDCVEFFATGE